MSRKMTILTVAVLVLLAACGGPDAEVGHPETTAPLTTTMPLPEPDPTTAVPITSTSTRVSLAPIVLERDGAVTTGVQNGETVFTVTHDPTRFANLEMTPEPNGVLTSLGWKGSVWEVHEFVPGEENSPGEYLQVEIHRLWPADQALDLLWLTDYSGTTWDTLTGFTPQEPFDTFTLFDALLLEGQLDRFGLHADCRTPEDDIGVALLSFEDGAPVPLMAWTFDLDTMTFVELVSPQVIEPGDCMAPEPRS